MTHHLYKKNNKICLRTLQNNLVIRLFQCNALHLKLDLRCKFQLSIVPWNNLIRVVVMRYDTIKIIKTQIHGQVNNFFFVQDKKNYLLVLPYMMQFRIEFYIIW